MGYSVLRRTFATGKIYGESRYGRLAHTEVGEIAANEENKMDGGGVASIMLVEDHASFRQALAFILETEPELAVIAQAGTSAEAREAMAGSADVDIAVVDLGLPGGDGVELIRELSGAGVTSLVLTASVDRGDLARAVEAGAAGVVHKATAVEEVVDAVRRLWRGEALLSPSEVVEMLRTASKERSKDRAMQRSFERLTPREREVLAALSEGLDSKEVARKLHITVETERTHVVNILTKLGAHSRLQAIILAARHGIVELS